ncbi:hypothetical protein [Peptostreptococcus equinus]|uniref:Uncharacterized protein n=1 Tax=Peptostreptococcus equinus TaxID=3003601 RepID=A0ABY7JMX5_9FIRM|nr:hypothetical protein [Peptostreptococcus sp. CBA3647]WAW14726.1 hypothetical protein O0R46_09095 [Peptostreptococcus sp. CBA3647]
MKNLTKNQAICIEQFLIENSIDTSKNKLNQVEFNHEFYKPAMEWAEDYIDKNSK